MHFYSASFTYYANSDKKIQVKTSKLYFELLQIKVLIIAIKYDYFMLN